LIGIKISIHRIQLTISPKYYFWKYF